MGTEWRWGTVQALVARALAEGAVGTPRLSEFMLHASFLAPPDAEAPDWWADPAQGGGWLQAHAPHVIDQVRVSSGEFEGVSAALPRVGEHTWRAEDSYTVRFRTTTGVEGIMQDTASDWGPSIHTTRIVGTTGTLWVEGRLSTWRTGRHPAARGSR